MTKSLLSRLAPVAVVAGAALMMAPAAHAQSANTSTDYVGKQAGTFMVRARVIEVAPLDSSSSISAIGGTVHASTQIAPEVDLSYFLTDNVAVEAIAASTRHELQARGTALGTVDVGIGKWRAFQRRPREVGARKVGARQIPVVQAGVDYNITGHWFLNADVKVLLLSPTANIDTSLGVNLKAKVALNPLVAGVGVGYRF